MRKLESTMNDPDESDKWQAVYSWSDFDLIILLLNTVNSWDGNQDKVYCGTEHLISMAQFTNDLSSAKMDLKLNMESCQDSWTDFILIVTCLQSHLDLDLRHMQAKFMFSSFCVTELFWYWLWQFGMNCMMWLQSYKLHPSETSAPAPTYCHDASTNRNYSRVKNEIRTLGSNMTTRTNIKCWF